MLPLLLAVSLFGYSVGQSFSTIENVCFAPPVVDSQPLDQSLTKPFESDYKLYTILTDWTSNTTTMVLETNTTSHRVILTTNRAGRTEQWVNQQNEQSAILYNITDNSCGVKAKAAPFELPPRYTELLKTNASSIADIVRTLVNFSQSNKGMYLNTTSVVAGIEGVRWVTCINGTNATSVQIEVVFAGDKAIKPASAAFDTPIALLLRVAEYNTFNDTAPKSAFSMEFSSYESLTADDNNTHLTPPGVVCDGLNASSTPSIKFSDPLDALIQIVDDKGVTTLVKHHMIVTIVRYSVSNTNKFHVHHSATNKVVGVSSKVSAGSIVPLMNEKAIADAELFIHDFANGYEYAFVDEHCTKLAAIPLDAADVVVSTGIASQKTITDMFLNVSLPFVKYQTEAKDGVNEDVYRAIDGSEVIELRLRGESLVSVQRFVKATSTSGPVSKGLIRILQSSGVSLTSGRRAMDCFALAASNSTFQIQLKDKKLADVSGVGEQTVTWALAKALSSAFNVSPLRIRAFYDERNGGVNVYFAVSEKSTVVPSPVVGYNYTSEGTTAEFVTAFNSSLSKTDWQFDVPTAADKTKTEKWTITVSSLSVFPPTPPPPGPPSFNGYSSGSMFVLGVFSLLLGAGIGAGGLFFITKRQRISTLAYQVFE